MTREECRYQVVVEWFSPYTKEWKRQGEVPPYPTGRWMTWEEAVWHKNLYDKLSDYRNAEIKEVFEI